MTDERILRRGDRGEWVSHLQQLLAKAGYDPGPVDGEFGDKTQAAAWAFQRALGLAVDGVIGADTWFSLHVPAGASATAALALTKAAIPARAANQAGVVVDRGKHGDQRAGHDQSDNWCAGAGGAGEDLWEEVVPASRHRHLRLPQDLPV